VSLAEVLITEEEGCILEAAIDTMGYWFIGYGHTLGISNAENDALYRGLIWTQLKSDLQLEKDMAAAENTARQFPNWGQMNDNQQAALISMTFQLGDKPLNWPDFMGALTAQDWNAAAAAGLDSDWAKFQTPGRAKREMQILSSGQWVNS
jgi:GH24 family phage-related lysozyme (muramidase)